MSPSSAAPLPPFGHDRFVLSGPDVDFAAEGIARALPSGGLASLAQRAGQFFATLTGEDPSVLVGAVPFAPDASDALYQPKRLSKAPKLAAGGALPKARDLHETPSRAQFETAVARALTQISEGAYRKIVLSRALDLLLDAPCDAGALLARLARDRSVTSFLTPISPEPAFGAPRQFLGATPELLVHKSGDAVVSHPLAGSARRRADRAADEAAAQGLLASDKDLREHRMAAEMVRDTLAPYCRTLAAPAAPALRATAQMWHLGTRISGTLRDPQTPCAELLAALHPTPAVCGMPQAAAAAHLPPLEGYDRGFYAGGVGWLDGKGDGTWYLALRCAQISGRQARLYAGAGIVQGSDPAAETAETSAKFLAMLSAFGLEEDSVRNGADDRQDA